LVHIIKTCPGVCPLFFKKKYPYKRRKGDQRYGKIMAGRA
jgi:hypothetical protein